VTGVLTYGDSKSGTGNEDTEFVATYMTSRLPKDLIWCSNASCGVWGRSDPGNGVRETRKRRAQRGALDPRGAYQARGDMSGDRNQKMREMIPEEGLN
jgi:hypothetical protein